MSTSSKKVSNNPIENSRKKHISILIVGALLLFLMASCSHNSVESPTPQPNATQSRFVRTDSLLLSGRIIITCDEKVFGTETKDCTFSALNDLEPATVSRLLAERGYDCSFSKSSEFLTVYTWDCF